MCKNKTFDARVSLMHHRHKGGDILSHQLFILSLFKSDRWSVVLHQNNRPDNQKLFIRSESDNGVDMNNSDVETQLLLQHFHILIQILGND